MRIYFVIALFFSAFTSASPSFIEVNGYNVEYEWEKTIAAPSHPSQKTKNDQIRLLTKKHATGISSDFSKLPYLEMVMSKIQDN